MLLLAISMIAQLKAGNASRYGYVGDTLDNVGSFACRGSLEARYGSRVWRKMRDHGVANRTLPCGTPLGVCNPRTGLCTAAYVVDRGPWGALDRKGVWHARVTLKKGEHYRGELDLLPGVYTAIGLVGIESVWFWPLPKEEPPPPPLPPRIKLPRLRAAGPLRYAMSFSPLQTPLAFK
jgi:hypothetical protein